MKILFLSWAWAIGHCSKGNEGAVVGGGVLGGGSGCGWVGSKSDTGEQTERYLSFYGSETRGEGEEEGS